MTTKRYQALTIVAVVVVIGLGAVTATRSEVYFLRTRVPACRCMKAYSFERADQAASGTLTASASTAENLTQPTDPEGQTKPTSRRKRFFFNRDTLTVSHVTLKNPSIVMYDTGEIDATALLDHDGGQNASMLGGDVVVRLQFFAGITGFRGSMTNVPLLAETQRELFVKRGSPKRESLLPQAKVASGATAKVRRFLQPTDTSLTGLVKQDFDQLTHVMLVLEYYPSP